ncbi:MAG: hypothetical protein Ct9H300mP23_08310 [Nitrospinota bacterium]|nr:MAG: hypothetical protein Ct9H300mP23_08310 [Nitrospinota bacterium]
MYESCWRVELGAVDAASHNNSIYIADDAGYYWIVGAGNTIEKKKINNSSGYKLSEITGISVNSVGNVYVAGTVRKNNKNYTAYWKNGELVKTFRENGTYDSEKHVAADSKGNVFIPGSRVDGHHNNDGAIWINGNIKILKPETEIVEATDAFVGSETASGSNVWISGTHGTEFIGIIAGWILARKPNGTINNVTKVTKVKTYDLPKNQFPVVELHQSLLKVQQFTWQAQLMSLTLVMYQYTGKIKFSMSFL